MEGRANNLTSSPMKVSIILPIYNVGQYIETCLKSILEQIGSFSMELILVDDCGNDDSIKRSLSILNDSCCSYQLLKHDKNRGISAARNTALLKALGDYVLFVDSDDILASNCLKELCEAAEMIPDADVIVGQFDEFMEESKYYPSEWKQKNGVYSNNVIEEYLKGNIPATAWNKLIKRSFLFDHKLFFEEGLIHEDALWSFQVACMSFKIVVTDSVTYHYRQRSGSLDKQNNQELHLYNYSRVNYLQLKYVFEYSLEKENCIYHFLEKNRFQLLIDAYRCNRHLSKEIYKLFKKFSYWNLWQRTTMAHTTMKIWLRNLHWSLPAKLGYHMLMVVYRNR